MTTKSRRAAGRSAAANAQPKQPTRGAAEHATAAPAEQAPAAPGWKRAAKAAAVPAGTTGAAAGAAGAAGTAGRPGGKTGARARPAGGPTRRELRQREEELARARRQPKDRRLLWLAGGVVALALIGGSVFGVVQGLNAAKPVALEETHQPTTGYNQHVPVGTDIQYAYEPPSSGPHYPTPANWGVYPQALPKGTWVHNLEHGGIVVLYRCDSACAQTQQQMQDLYNQIPFDDKFNERKVVITPYDGLDQPVRVQAWGWTLPLDHVDQAKIDAFYKEHVDQGPEQIP